MRCAKLFFATLLIIFGDVSTQSQTLSIDATLANMSLEEKVGQLFVMTFFGAQLNEPARDLLQTWQPGAVVLLPSNLENSSQITRLTNDIQQTLLDSGSVPVFIGVDQEGGIISRLGDGFTQWAVPSLLTATQNTDLAYQFGLALATELQAVGINMNLAPVADLQTNLDNPIIGRRAFGHDPDLTSPIISAVIEGMQNMGVLATVKHFPGHGDTDVDSHLELPVLDFSLDDLFARELMPFQSAIDSNVGAVMVAHIDFPQLTEQSDIPASLSQVIITDLLRETMGYDGIVITDALDMDAIDTVYSPASAAIQAINAGNDLILLGAHISPDNIAIAMQAVVDAVQNGDISSDRIDESVRRVLLAKERFGLFNWTPLDSNTATQRINTQVHSRLIDTMFVEGITLVHDDAQALPLSDRTLMVYPQNRSTLGLACNRNNWQFTTIARNPSDETIATITQSAQYVDNVVVFTENVNDYPQQIELVSALPADKTVVVALWSPFDLLYLPPIATYFVTYSPLSQSYAPICDILHGEIQALGTLSVLLERQ